MLRIFIALLVYLLVGCSTTSYVHNPNISIEKMIGLHYEQVSSRDGQEYERVLMARHNQYWSKFSLGCFREANEAGIDEIYLVVVIDASGSVLEVNIAPDVNKTSCFKENVKKIPYPSHEFGVFYELFLVGDSFKHNK